MPERKISHKVIKCKSNVRDVQEDQRNYEWSNQVPPKP